MKQRSNWSKLIELISQLIQKIGASYWIALLLTFNFECAVPGWVMY